MVETLEPTQYAVLNVVALKKMATPTAIVEASGLTEPEVVQLLAHLADENLVTDLGGNVLPTDDAVPTLDAAASRLYERVRSDDDVQAAAERFARVNSAFLDAMSAWQLVPLGDRTVTNDHSDAAYDEKVITRIDRLVRRLDPVIETLARHDPRFARYGARLEAALARIDQQEIDFVSSPAVDSVHNVWFEFHEDLLRTLGHEREE